MVPDLHALSACSLHILQQVTFHPHTINLQTTEQKRWITYQRKAEEIHSGKYGFFPVPTAQDEQWDESETDREQECLVFQAAYCSQINTEWHPSSNPIDVEDHYHSRQPLNQLLSSLMLMLFTYQRTGLRAFVCTTTKSLQQQFA